MMSFLGIADPSRTGGTDDGERQSGEDVVFFREPSGLELSCSFDESDFSSDIRIKDGVKGEDLGEKGVEFKVDGLDG
jgi:hypothetical protein